MKPMKKAFLSALLLLVSCSVSGQGNVNFTEAFKKENQGKYKIEVNEVKELLIIMMAISDYGLGNDDMFEQRGTYHQRVLKHFKPYKDEPIIKTMDSLLHKSPLNYIFLTGNAPTHSFHDDTLAPNEVYILPANEVSNVRIEQNPIITYKKEVEAFARKSGFRNFYRSEKPFYDHLIADYEQYANIGRQWQWLEQHFEEKINSYIVYTSALINGLNYTGGYENNHFHLIEMVLPPIDNVKDKSEKANEAFNTRVMFTEIDHNYVNKPSTKYKKEINEALKERGKWVNTKTYGTEYYPDGFKVFNEYMTFGAFVLYAEDVYKNDPKLLKEINDDVVNVMADRGFVKMKEFNEQLKSLRKKQKRKKIDALYPKLLAWCAEQ